MNLKVSTAKILFFITRLFKRIWVSAFLYALLAVFTAFIALFAKDFIPKELSTKVSIEAVADILTILASSMLAVATFSLSIMVIAFGNVSNNATPRATKLIIENQSAQRAVATFIGVFMYSIVGIIALTTNSYGASGRFILLLVTIIVVIVIVVTLIKWIDQLSTLGQVGNTIAEIEKKALASITQHAKDPYLGGQRLEIDHTSSLSDQMPIISEKVGFVVLIDMKQIQQICEEQNIKLSVIVLPGSFVYPGRVLARVNTNVGQSCLMNIASLFVIEKDRTFKQDSRFGFLLLSEIASRALSQGVNDPGTAIEAINSATRLLKIRSDLIRENNSTKKKYAYRRIFVRQLKGEELIKIIFAPIIRDGSNMFEVGIKVQKSLKAIKNYDSDYRDTCDFYANFTTLHFNSSLKTQHEKDLVANAWSHNISFS